jgi:hypothetical protein
VRAFCVILAVAHALFLNVFVPMHTRGAVVLEVKGQTGAVAEARGGGGGCCAADGPAEERKPDSRDRARCAVCYLVATYVPAIPTSLDLEPAGLVARVREHVLAQVTGMLRALPYFPSGPPGRG